MKNKLLMLIATVPFMLFSCKEIQEKRYRLNGDCSKIEVYKRYKKVIDSIVDANPHIYLTDVDTLCDVIVKYDEEYLSLNSLTNIYIKTGLVIENDTTQFDPVTDSLDRLQISPQDTLLQVVEPQDTISSMEGDSSSVINDSTAIQADTLASESIIDQDTLKDEN